MEKSKFIIEKALEMKPIDKVMIVEALLSSTSKKRKYSYIGNWPSTGDQDIG